jgi:dipeptidase D
VIVVKEFDKLKSKKVFEFFYELNAVPRPSKKEEKVSNFLKKFAEDRKLEVVQDKAWNIIVKKEGTGSLKNAPTVILQGHMDMVTEKKPGSKHNFDTDPIEMEVSGDILKAKGTTLGADNGLGASMILAILDDDKIEHPPLECLFTSDEETGMTGAHALDVSQFTGKILLNLDTEEEGKFYLSCAGGNVNLVTIPVSFSDTKGLAVDFEVSGLLGGHSGLMIGEGRANANKIVGRFLGYLEQAGLKFNIISVEGGNKNNAITREAKAELVIDAGDLDKVDEIAKSLQEALKTEYTPQDKDVKVKLSKKKDGTFKAMSAEDSARVTNALALIPYGPLYYSKIMEDLVQTSSNIGVLATTKDAVTLESTIRSSVKTQQEEIIAEIDALAKLLDAKVDNNSFYPAWPLNTDSKIKDLCIKVWKKDFKEEPEIVAIHAGLECGILKEKMPDIDAISFGPNIEGAHTTEEQASISSTERTWEFLLDLLKAMKDYK